MTDKEQNAQFPGLISPGDTVAIAAPASPFDKHMLMQGISVLENMGFIVHVPEEIFNRTGYLAGSDFERAKLLNTLFADPDIKAIFCARGGYGVMRILSLLDFDVIRDNPKIFAGFSDITVLLNAFYRKCGLVTFHTPLVTTLPASTENTKKRFFEAFTADIWENIVPESPVIIRSGHAGGPLVGGNLSLLCHTTGTPYAPDFKGAILFLEDRGEALYRIDRKLMHLKLAGCFDDIAGLAVGSFRDCGDISEIHNLISDLVRDEKIPILCGFAIGHEDENITVPVGAMVTLDTERNAIIVSKQVAYSKQRGV
ncbi:MAG: LD-carboxypeptidase [Desulfobacterales bacterium]|nr:LD-carboxypeptidase [Desulfobacterales bacterium]